MCIVFFFLFLVLDFDIIVLVLICCVARPFLGLAVIVFVCVCVKPGSHHVSFLPFRFPWPISITETCIAQHLDGYQIRKTENFKISRG